MIKKKILKRKNIYHFLPKIIGFVGDFDIFYPKIPFDTILAENNLFNEQVFLIYYLVSLLYPGSNETELELSILEFSLSFLDSKNDYLNVIGFIFYLYYSFNNLFF